MKAINYNGELYILVRPVQKLFNSTMIHDVCTRGDFFAVRLSNRALTVIPAGAVATQVEVTVSAVVQTRLEF